MSTTHCIVGSMVGFGLVYGGAGAVFWSSIARVTSSWVISPVMGALVSFLVYKCIRRVRLQHNLITVFSTFFERVVSVASPSLISLVCLQCAEPGTGRSCLSSDCSVSWSNWNLICSISTQRDRPYSYTTSSGIRHGWSFFC